jgi:hypothetical protein
MTPPQFLTSFNKSCPHQARWGWARGPPSPRACHNSHGLRTCQRHNPYPIIVCAAAGEEVTPGCTELLVLKLDGDNLLLGAPPVHLSDLANIPVVVALAEPAAQASGSAQPAGRAAASPGMLYSMLSRIPLTLFSASARSSSLLMNQGCKTTLSM